MPIPRVLVGPPPMTRRPDDEVVGRAKSGDPEAWRVLYQQQTPRLRIWLRALPTGDAAVDSDDVVASAWLTASRRILEFTGTSADFAGWLFTIARNVALTTQARSARRATRPVDCNGADPVLWGTAADPAGTVEGVDLALALIRGLPRRESEVVACIDLAGFDIATTAEVLGISRAAVRVSHHRGISRLRDQLSVEAPNAHEAGASVKFSVQPASEVS
ncbi:MAG: RNA polymerase sigma factor [Nocardioides sp.]|nr:RNA polymerase sigma factor [Nocardioides sp.]